MDCLLSCDHSFGGSHDHCLCRLVALGKATDGKFEGLQCRYIHVCEQIVNGAVCESRIVCYCYAGIEDDGFFRSAKLAIRFADIQQHSECVVLAL